ncbi:hypothetical protein ACFY4C_13270 [Actinomadura viridis]|uniref:hypothetical protein n=1 Tax=Actinomadura viridis TaxID=58110 RepID=UPI0036778DF5
MPEQSPTRFTMVPARRSDEPTARKRARRVLGALFLASGLSVVAVVIALADGSSEPDLSKVDPKGRDLAHMAAVNHLAGQRQNVPRADSYDPEEVMERGPAGRNGPLAYRSLNWVGFSPQHFGSEKLGFTDFEVHHFLVVLEGAAGTPTQAPGTQAPGTQTSGAPAPGRSPAASRTPSATGASTASPASPAAARQATPPASGAPSGTPSGAPSGGGPTPGASPSASPSPTEGGVEGTDTPPSNVLQLDVPVLLDPKGPRLAAAPAFSIWRRGAGDVGGRGDYTNYRGLTVEVSDATKNQILLWAKAYATGDSAGLLAVTGDQNGDHRYVGLSGFTLPESGRAVQIMSAIKAANGHLIVRVRVLLARAAPGGTVPGRNGGEQRFTTFADFDLLVGARSGAQPPILAWGPAGSAAELEPYYNALGS